MKSLLTLGFLTLIVALIGFFAPIRQSAANEAQKKPTLVIFHSDYCGSCKILAPKLEQALSTIDEGSIHIVKFDYTSKDTINASKILAAANDLSDLQKQYGAKTGFALIVDEDSDAVHRIQASDDVNTITQSIQDHQI